MTKISAEIIADSEDGRGNRITTFVLTFPRFILAELNTHRMFSKNSASSRAIPFKKMVESVQNDPFIPIAWQKDHKGMQGSEYITDEIDVKLNTDAWLKARDNAISSAKYLNHGVKDGRDNGVTKQLCNRLLEPFMWHKVILTATSFENFFELRCPKYTLTNHSPQKEVKVYHSKKDAELAFGSELEQCARELGFNNSKNQLFWFGINEGQSEIHMMALAEAMWDSIQSSVPKLLKEGEWHIPFGDKINEDVWYALTHVPNEKYNENSYDDFKLKIATARCARISYTTVGDFEKKIDYESDIKLHDRLLAEGHYSPFEHCARMMTDEEEYSFVKGVRFMNGTVSMLNSKSTGWCNNFKGFIQYRYLLQNNLT